MIGGVLYHSTSSKGLHKIDDWNPLNWDLFETKSNESTALLLFDMLQGAKYDWFSLLSFLGFKAKDASKLYCFEWCYIALKGEMPDNKVTPETLLLIK